MSERRLSEQDIYDAIDCPEHVEEGRGLTMFVAKHADGTYWMFHLRNEDVGWKIVGDTLAIEVEPVQVTVTQWVAKK